jgi:hypothetical protein
MGGFARNQHIGQAYIKKSPIVRNGIQQYSIEWGRQVGADVAKEVAKYVQQKGYKL